MGSLVIVESPTKAKTLTRFLGNGYKIVASMGHIRDLPRGEIGVDVEKEFAIKYVIPKDKRKQVSLLRNEALNKNKIILATDPDREGEAIAFHVKNVLETDKKFDKKTPFERIVFHEITKDAVNNALKSPRQINLNLFHAQQARRVLDRLVGYKLSPLLWFKIKKGLSAGRVQSVAVRLIVIREREILAFKPEEYWLIKVIVAKIEDSEENGFTASLVEIDSQKAEIKKQEEAQKIVEEVNKADFIVTKIDSKDVKRSPAPPFTTSTLQQTASNRLGFSSKQTMMLAQGLYEEGHITYHRTDSLNVAETAITNVRKFIEKTYGKDYLPEKANYYKTKSKGAQEAHEAIRPTYIERNIEEITLSSNHKRLYELILNRFIASQMTDALYNQKTVEIKASKYLFRTTGTKVVFAGWRKVYGVKAGDPVSENGEEVKIPELTLSEKLNLLNVIPEQKFTQPPPRYTEASLIKALEENGIGRPSTYAPIMSTIVDRGYVLLEERKLKPTDLGILVNDFVVKYFPDIVDTQFTAQMEEKLDTIAEGQSKWLPVISEFYTPFEKNLTKVNATAEKIEIPIEKTGEKCPDCKEGDLIIRTGKFGKFIACDKFPNCKYTKQFIEKINMKCPDCKEGDVIIKRTKRGKIFYGCSNYPNCKFASWKKPVIQPIVPNAS